MKKSLYVLFAVLVTFVSVSGVQAIPDDELNNSENTEVSEEANIKDDLTEGFDEASKTNENPEKITETVGTYDKVICGDKEIPALFPKIVSTIILVIQILVPIVIIIFGSFDLVRAVMARKEDDIKKGQQMFLKRLITGLVVFLIVVMVKFVIGIVAPHDANNSMWDCVDCFISGKCQ